MEKLSVILPAAGKSTRFGGGGVKKVFSLLAGKPVWLRSAEIFSSLDFVEKIVVVLSPDDQDFFHQAFANEIKDLNLLVVAGGKERHQSVQNGLIALFPELFRSIKLNDTARGDSAVVHPLEIIVDQSVNHWVAIHDAARPLVRPAQVKEVFSEAVQNGAAILGSPITATIKKVSRQKVEKTVDRTGLFSAQTPQIFSTSILTSAYAHAEQTSQDSIPTDECLLLESAGFPVSMVIGDDQNIKLTHQSDMVLAEAILAARENQ